MSNLSSFSESQAASFQAWRAITLGEMPYMGRILFAVRVLAAPGLGTFAVDKHYRMYIDFDAVEPRNAHTGRRRPDRSPQASQRLAW